MPEASSAVITTQVTPRDVQFGSVEVDGLRIAYREAGDPKAPKLVLLHGFRPHPINIATSCRRWPIDSM